MALVAYRDMYASIVLAEYFDLSSCLIVYSDVTTYAYLCIYCV